MIMMKYDHDDNYDDDAADDEYDANDSGER